MKEKTEEKNLIIKGMQTKMATGNEKWKRSL